jgi:hypothetical protein
MKHAKLAIAIMLIASLVVPTVDAKSKAPVRPTPPATSQAGGLPATNARLAALEGTVATLRGNLAAETATRIAADAALASQIAASQSTVFVTEGSADNIKGATVTVASKIVPAGNYFMLAAVQMTNGQVSGDANARCVMRANGTLLADTSDLQFPILTAAAGPPSGAFGSTMFAPLQGSYTSSTPITVSVECTESNGKNGGLAAFVQVAAMKMGSVQ